MKERLSEMCCSALADITFIINRGCHTLCILMNCPANSFGENSLLELKPKHINLLALWNFLDHKNGEEMLF